MDEVAEICEGYTQRMLKCYWYLQQKETKEIFHVPVDILVWIWFLAYVVNYNHNSERDFYMRVPSHTLFPELKRRQGDFQRIVDNYSHEFYEHGRPFEVNYTVEKGFHLISRTSVWDFVVKGVTGLCYKTPTEVVDGLDKLGFFYFHEEGLIVGPLAFVNHECDCDVSYGFDWPMTNYKRSTCIQFKQIRVVPVYLSWDHALVEANLLQRRLIPERSEIVVKYFNSSSDTYEDNIRTWFGVCSCCACASNRIVNTSALTRIDNSSTREIMGVKSHTIPNQQTQHHIYKPTDSKKEEAKLLTSIFVRQIPSFIHAQSRRGVKTTRRRNDKTTRIYIKRSDAVLKAEFLRNLC
jgi:hypothetical protein